MGNLLTKVWKYIYEDDMTKEIIDMPNTGQTTSLSCKNRELFIGKHISYNTKRWKAYIHSDEEIPGLKPYANDRTEIPDEQDESEVHVHEITEAKS